MLEDEDIYIFTSNGPKNKEIYKISYHMLVCAKQFAFRDNKEGYNFAKLVQTYLPEKYKESLDFATYNGLCNLRMNNCYKTPEPGEKINTNRIKRMLFPNEIDFKTSLITYVGGLVILDKLCGNGDSKEFECNITNFNLQNVINLLPQEDRNSFIIRKVHKNIINFDRLKPSYCKFCNRIHEKDNTLYLSISDDKVYKSCIKCKNSSEFIGKIDEQKIIEEDSDNDFEIINFDFDD